MIKRVSVEDGAVKLHTLLVILYIMVSNEQANTSVQKKYFLGKIKSSLLSLRKYVLFYISGVSPVL